MVIASNKHLICIRDIYNSQKYKPHSILWLVILGIGDQELHGRNQPAIEKKRVDCRRFFAMPELFAGPGYDWSASRFRSFFQLSASWSRLLEYSLKQDNKIQRPYHVRLFVKQMYGIEDSRTPFFVCYLNELGWEWATFNLLSILNWRFLAETFFLDYFKFEIGFYWFFNCVEVWLKLLEIEPYRKHDQLDIIFLLEIP